MKEFKEYWNKLTLSRKFRFIAIVIPALIFLYLDIFFGKLAEFFEAVNEYFLDFAGEFVRGDKKK